jgi:two-component system, sensor histidine kinase LadS
MRFAAWCLGLLLSLVGPVAALGQASANGANAAVPPDFAAISLSPELAVIGLAERSRFWIDPTAFRTPDQVEATSSTLPWAVLQANRRYDLDEKALWVQFDATSHASGHYVLEVGSSTVAKAQLFYRGGDGNWVQQQAGSDFAVSDWPLPGRYPTFELSTEHDRPVRYWLRLEQDHVEFTAPLRIYRASWLLPVRERVQFLFGAYFGLIALVALGSVANAIVHRDRNFAVFSLYVAALGVGQLAAFGLGEEHLWDGWPKWNETAMFLLPGISSAVGLWFARNVTEPARFSRALDLAVWSLIAAVLSAAALDTLLASPNSFRLVMLVMIVGMAVIGGLLLLALTHAEDPHIGLIATGFVPILVMGVLTALAGLNILPPSALTREGLPLGAAIGVPLLFYALSLRTSHRREAQLRAASLVRHDVLTGIAHERTLLNRLQGAIERARDLKQQCALMVLRISNFEALTAEFGRETADRALVVAASLLRRAATDIDLEARVGDQDFALLVEGPTTAENAMNRAQELVARGLRSSTALPATAVLKFHVAVALLPEAARDAAASLQWLLDAVETMPPDSRKLIRPMNF